MNSSSYEYFGFFERINSNLFVFYFIFLYVSSIVLCGVCE
jgi:hypothetical protein